MNIAMLTNNYKPFVGGVPISIERLSNGLSALGHNVFIFAPTYEEQKQEENVIRYKSLKKKLAGFIVVPNGFDNTIEKKMRELEIDIIHTHHPMIIGNVALLLGRKLNIPIVFTYHTKYEEYLHYLIKRSLGSNFLNRFYNVFEKFVRSKVLPSYISVYANRCNLILAPGNLIEEYLIQTGINRTIEILPTGVPESLFDINWQLANTIREAYIGGKKFLFCTVSRLSKEKNIDFIISGLHKLKNELGDNFNFLIIGDGPERKNLEILCKKLDLDNNVIFMGEKANEEIKEYQAASDLFLFASTSETQGIVLIEAMATGLGVIAVKSTGVNDVVIDGFNGITTAKDTNEWLEGIKKTIYDDDFRVHLSNGAYKTARKYSCTNIALKAEGLYKKVLKEKANEQKTVCIDKSKKDFQLYNLQIFKRS